MKFRTDNTAGLPIATREISVTDIKKEIEELFFFDNGHSIGHFVVERSTDNKIWVHRRDGPPLLYQLGGFIGYEVLEQIDQNEQD